MDMQLLDSLDTSALLLTSSDEKETDPFTTDAYAADSTGTPPPDAYLFLSPDPFAPDPADPADHQLPPEPSCAEAAAPHPKAELVLHPFDTPAIPLANSVPHVPHHPVATAAPSSPLQENRASSNNVPCAVARPGVRKVPGKPKVGAVKRQPSLVKKEGVALDDAARVKDKLAQRKLRNKESARRYREKQVARRRQLENYTRSLTEQNRELETLHDKLLTLTCERKMRGFAEGTVSGEGVSGNVI